jgi:transcriptional regulator with XRE-family HTH domain
MMEVWEKINYLLDEKNIAKKDFVDKLLELEPKLKQTGEIPSVQTVYRYLNNQREIKIELIPFIAETLEVTEQELFTNDIEYSNNYNIRYSKEAKEILDLLKYAPKGAVEDVKDYLMKFKNVCDGGIGE